MSDADIDKMVKDAEAHEAEDKDRREAIEARNQLDSMLYQAKKQIEENGDKVPEELKLQAEEEFKSAQAVLDEHKEPINPAPLRESLESLQTIVHKIAEAMYKTAAAPDDAGEGGDDLGEDLGGDDLGEDLGGSDEAPADDGVIDAEFEETT